jgi:hypothetical protein
MVRNALVSGTFFVAILHTALYVGWEHMFQVQSLHRLISEFTVHDAGV